MDIKNKTMNYLVKEFDEFDVIDKSLEKTIYQISSAN